MAICVTFRNSPSRLPPPPAPLPRAVTPPMGPDGKEMPSQPSPDVC
ncbi:hypothetical protein E2C01_101007 [Portunus trituberculatus]|uniref:Uncharacterized protein n=1 Tax=Portunus trituberculatus TaxID=210409 RepID=A0A5B7KES6_PORTR|nr:hypothetical protein [Portunus trituberculatus]